MLTPVTSAIAPHTSSRIYPGAPEQVRAIRANLRVFLSGCPHADDIILCASELAANAIIHSNSAQPGGTITVHAEIHGGDFVRVEVRDDGGTWAPPTADADRPHGRDLLTILATTWGVTETTTGRTAWAQLRWPRAISLGLPGNEDGE